MSQPFLVADRPREKLWSKGARALGTNELLAVILGTGTGGLSALDLANRLLALGGGVQGLSRMEPLMMASLPGLKTAKAARVSAVFELGRRAQEISPGPESGPWTSPAAVARYLMPRFSDLHVENFGALYLDVRHRLKHEAVLFTGTLDGSLVHPRELFREAVLARASSLIVFHDHPSGDPSPSEEDHRLTRRLDEAGSVMGIELLDHLILGRGRFYSFQADAKLRRRPAVT